MSDKLLWRVQRKETVIREFYVSAETQSEAEEAAGEFEAIDDVWRPQADDGTIASYNMHWPSAHIVGSAECRRLVNDVASLAEAVMVYDVDECKWVEMASALAGIVA